MILWLWISWFLFRALFWIDPAAFGRGCVRLALSVVSRGLATESKCEWADEVMSFVELEIWEARKRLHTDGRIGAVLILHAVDLLIQGWSDRRHYRQSLEQQRPPRHNRSPSVLLWRLMALMALNTSLTLTMATMTGGGLILQVASGVVGGSALLVAVSILLRWLWQFADGGDNHHRDG